MSMRSPGSSIRSPLPTAAPQIRTSTIVAEISDDSNLRKSYIALLFDSEWSETLFATETPVPYNSRKKLRFESYCRRVRMIVRNPEDRNTTER
jgi:hypothetical protein